MDRLLYGMMPVRPVERGEEFPAVGTDHEPKCWPRRSSGRCSGKPAATSAASASKSAVTKSCLSGRCGTYHTKQKAQHAAMGFCSSGRQLNNRIEVT